MVAENDVAQTGGIQSEADSLWEIDRPIKERSEAESPSSGGLLRQPEVETVHLISRTIENPGKSCAWLMTKDNAPVKVVCASDRVSNPGTTESSHADEVTSERGHHDWGAIGCIVKRVDCTKPRDCTQGPIASSSFRVPDNRIGSYAL